MDALIRRPPLIDRLARHVSSLAHISPPHRTSLPLNVRYTARAHTPVVSNVRLEDIPEPRLRSRFLDVAVSQMVPNSDDDYHRCRDRAAGDQRDGRQ
ncbi:MAG: hypothetical protein IMY86_07335, partial [Chloroflexi bacterium]|nr:hypothetical protein [Chloroflexota bacterium]